MKSYKKRGISFGLQALARDARAEVLDAEELALMRELEQTRPQTRGDCAEGARPCPFISCRYHLYLEVTEAGSVRFPFPGLELDELKETCALDVADRGENTLEDLALLLGVTRERVRQIETVALDKLRKRGLPLREFRYKD